MTKWNIFNHKDSLFQTSIFFQHSEKIKNIIDILNLHRIAIIQWIHNAGKTSIINELIKKIWREKEVYYFDKNYDIHNRIKTAKDLQKAFLEEIEFNKNIKIIVLKNINKIEKIKDFLNFIYLHDNKFKIIIISNTIKIQNCNEVTIYPERVSNIWKYYQLDHQLQYGTFPEVLLLWHNHFRKKHLQLMLNDIFTKDIYHSFWVKNITLYDFFIRYLARNNKYFSLRELHKCINIDLQISLKTIIDYCNFSQQSKIIFSVNPYDFKKQKVISTKSKYYFTDTWMRNSLWMFDLDISISKHNLLAQQLQSYKYNIFWWINGTFEFDFYATQWEKTICIHFGNHIEKQDLKKEINKLNKVPNKGAKYLIIDNPDELNIRKFIYDQVEIISYEKLFSKLFF